MLGMCFNLPFAFTLGLCLTGCWGKSSIIDMVMKYNLQHSTSLWNPIEMYVLVLPTRYTYNEKMEINFYRMELLSCFMQNIMYTETVYYIKIHCDNYEHSMTGLWTQTTTRGRYNSIRIDLGSTCSCHQANVIDISLLSFIFLFQPSSLPHIVLFISCQLIHSNMN